MNWTQFGTNSVWLVVLGGLAYFLGKSVIRTLLAADLQAHKASLDRRLEEFKSDLRRTAELELQRQRAEDEKRTIEHDASVRWLLNERAAAMTDVFLVMQDAVQAWRAPLDETNVFGIGAAVRRADTITQSFQNSIDRGALTVSQTVLDALVDVRMHIERIRPGVIALKDGASHRTVEEHEDLWHSVHADWEAGWDAVRRAVSLMRAEVSAPLGTVSGTEAPETS